MTNDDYRAWLLARLDKIEAMTSEHARNSADKLEQIAIDVAILKNEARRAEAHTKRTVTLLRTIISA